MEEQGNLTLEEAIIYAVAKFPAEEGQEEVDVDAKVARLSRITVDLKKQVEDLKAQQISSTPPEVLEECRKTTSKAVDQIKEGEKLFNEAVDAVFMSRELFLEDETTTKFVEDAHQADLKITAVKANMKKFPIKENIAKEAKLKQL